jgi:uncharacterized protein (TIGR03067 family)
MLRSTVTLAVLWFGVPPPGDGKSNPLPEPAKKELEKLQGNWVAKEFERHGQRVDVREANFELEIKGDKWIFTGKEKALIVALDPTTDPKCIDLKSVEDGRNGQVDEAIYRIEGDTLTICLYQGNGKSRPTRFETSPDQPDTILAVFERPKKK